MAASFQCARTRVELIQGDITTQDVDAIVNAANTGLRGGGGVDGAIHRAGGLTIDAECRRIIARIGRLPTGQAVLTSAGDMPARHVIHTVGPVYSGSADDPKLLASCFTESLQLAEKNGLSSVAFPAISCGVYGYPRGEAARVSLAAVADFCRRGTNVQLVRFVLFGHGAYETFLAAAEAMTWDEPG